MVTWAITTGTEKTQQITCLNIMMISNLLLKMISHLIDTVRFSNFCHDYILPIICSCVV